MRDELRSTLGVVFWSDLEAHAMRDPLIVVGPAALTVLPCLIELERKTPGIIAATQLFVGASSGAWTALYLARNMGLVDAKKITGEQLLQSCLAFLKSSLAAMQPPDLSGLLD